MTDKQLLDGWYRYASGANGFIGGALRMQRKNAFLFQEQQRILLGIGDGKYDQLWLCLQSMPLPRPDQFAADLERIVAKVVGETGEATLDRENLENFIREGLRTS